jgi:hypothetical protein
MQALAGLAGGVPTADSAKASAMKPLTDFINNGIQVDRIGLAFLSGIIPIPPLSYLGYGGLNLWAVGSLKYCAMKAALQAFCTMAQTFITAYYPKLWFLGFLLAYNPWYVFDILQLFSPTFAQEGFKLPFFNTKVSTSANPSVGKVTAPILAAAIALLCSGAYSLLSYFPESIQKAWKPVMNMVFLAIGGVTALAGGGLGGVVVIPQILSALKGESKALSAAVAAPTAPQSGGGEPLPSLGDIANRIMKDKIECPTQSGGGDATANIFLGSLVIAALGGITLALVRNKPIPPQ